MLQLAAIKKDGNMNKVKEQGQPGPMRKGEEMRVWHYTTLEAVKDIISDGEIKPAEKYTEDEIRGVWLSTNPNWEETVRKAFRDPATSAVSPALSRDALFFAGCTPIRIEIDLRTVNVADWRTHCNKIPKKLAQRLEASAKEWGANPDEWRVSYKSIRAKSFMSPIEAWNGERWETKFEDNDRKKRPKRVKP